MLRETELSLTTVLNALGQARCGDPHPVFAGGARYVPPSLARGIDDEARGELARYGLVDRRGRITDDFEDVLYAIGQAETEYVAYANEGDGQYGVLVGVRGRLAVAAVCRGERVWLRQVGRDTHPAEELVANLPSYAPARFTPFSVPQQELQPDDGDEYDDPPARSRDARMVQDLIGRGRRGHGLISAAKDAGGHRVATEDELTYLDTDEGRVAFGVSGAPGNRYVTVLPGEPGLLAQRVAGLRASLDH